VGAADVWENVARNLARQPAKASALDFMERARDIGRGAAHAMQDGFRRSEARETTGEPRATLGAQLRERQEGRAVAEAVDRLRRALDARWQAVRELADRLRQAGKAALRDGARKKRRPAEGQARAMRDRARDNQARSAEIAGRHRATRPRDERPARPVDAAGYWRRTAAGADGASRPSLRRAVQRRREEGAAAAVADRLAVALDERGAVLAGTGQGRGQKPAQAAQEPRQAQAQGGTRCPRGPQRHPRPSLPPHRGWRALFPGHGSRRASRKRTRRPTSR
jgi:hypothetical protein